MGDHRSSCAQVGVLAQRAGPLERAVARICRHAGARVAANVALRELNLDAPATDGRRIEVVANGLPLWRGAQIAIDTTRLKRDRHWPCNKPKRASSAPTPSSNQAGRHDAVWWCSAWRSADASIAKQSRCSAGQLALAPGSGPVGAGRSNRRAHAPLDRTRSARCLACTRAEPARAADLTLGRERRRRAAARRAPGGAAVGVL